MAIHLRLLSPIDNEPLASLIRAVFREFKIDRPGTVYTDPTTDHLYELFNHPGTIYWIAEQDGIMAGGCGVYPTKGLPDGCAELVKLYVKKESRGNGIGYLLMKQCINSARELGYRQLYLETLPELGKAVSMYERAGFKHICDRLGDSGHFGCNIWMLKELEGLRS
jgi:putative acetyltransferase